MNTRPALAVVKAKTPPKPINRPARLVHGELGTPARVFEARTADGMLMALHCRFEWTVAGKPKPEKTYRWWRTGWALDDLAAEDVPLYNAPALAAAAPDAPVWLCEGEPAAVALQEALRAAGYSAVVLATYGATAIPSDAQLQTLVGHTVTPWADRDDAGVTWRDMLTEKLQALGISVRVCVWPDAPPKGDAVEFFASGGTVAELVALTSPAGSPNLVDTIHGVTQAESPTEPRSITVERELRVMAEQANARLKARDAWDAKLRANTNLRPAYKPTVALIRDDWVRVARAPGTFMRVTREIMGEQLGVPVQTVGMHLKKLTDAGIIRKQTEHTYDEVTGLRRSHIAIAPTEAMLDHPEALAMLGWGGKRVQYCQNIECGSDDLIVHTTVTCRACGTIQRDDTHPLNEQADTRAPAQKNCPAIQDASLREAKISEVVFSHPWEVSEAPS